MSNEELHAILDNEDIKISLKELENIIYKLKEDCFEETYKLKDCSDIRVQFYNGEVNAFYIVLDLLEHVDLEKRDKSE